MDAAKKTRLRASQSFKISSFFLVFGVGASFESEGNTPLSDRSVTKL